MIQESSCKCILNSKNCTHKSNISQGHKGAHVVVERHSLQYSHAWRQPLAPRVTECQAWRHSTFTGQESEHEPTRIEYWNTMTLWALSFEGEESAWLTHGPFCRWPALGKKSELLIMLIFTSLIEMQHAYPLSFPLCTLRHLVFFYQSFILSLNLPGWWPPI